MSGKENALNDPGDPSGGILPERTDAEPSPAAVAASAGGGAFEASHRFNELATWQPPIRSADAEMLPEKPTLDARARDTLRNDAYVSGGATLHKDNIVGSHFLLNSKPETRVLWGRDDETWEREFQEEVEARFTLWSESPTHWPDAARINTLTGLVRLAVGVYTAGGEVLASAEWMPNDGRPFRSAIQMIDTDRLSTPPDRYGDSSIRGGVERDRRGAPIAYHIRRSHPSDYGVSDNWTWRRVMAFRPGWGRKNILHIYEQQRADQSRGISAMVAALSEMRMTKSFRKVELQRAVVAATYAASIESDLPTADVYTAMGADGTTGNPSTQWALDYLNAVNEYSGGAKNLYMDGARIPVFMPGTRLKLQNPGNNGPLGAEFESSLLRHIAASLGVSYEQLSRDYTQTNYSSARASMGETWKHMLTRKKLVADGTADFVYRLWLEEAVNHGEIEALKRRNVPAFYEGLNADAYAACEWIGAGQGQIDPLKETQASILKLRNGLSTKEFEIARLHGGDWRKVARQIARERGMDEELGNTSINEIERAGEADQEAALGREPQEKDA